MVDLAAGNPLGHDLIGEVADTPHRPT
jgi:hypothetical protein